MRDNFFSRNNQPNLTLSVLAFVISFVLMTLSSAFAQTARDTGTSRPPAQSTVPLTWQDEYFPEFRIRVKEADVTALLTKPETKGSETKYPMTLTYQGKDYDGTIRQRVPGTSSAADKKQFRLDFAKKITFPDGYIADRFETDHGNGFVLNEWLAWKMLNQAAQKHPNLKILRKKANLVAIYLNDKLYHVQTLIEDVNKDLLEPQLGTRKIETFKYGCIGRTGPTKIDNFCATFSPAQVQAMMDIPSFMYATAAVEVIGSYDNYPRFPNNFYLVQETETGRVWFMPDDMDTTIAPYDNVYSDPFQIAYSNGDSQRHFTEMLKDRACLELYYSYVKDLTSLWQPDQLKPAIAAKYAQIRSALFASGGLPYDEVYYDYLYTQSLPLWVDMRAQYLTGMMEQTTVEAVAKKVANQQ